MQGSSEAAAAAVQAPKQGRGSPESHPYLQVLGALLAALLPKTAEAKASQTFSGASLAWAQWLMPERSWGQPVLLPCSTMRGCQGCFCSTCRELTGDGPAMPGPSMARASGAVVASPRRRTRPGRPGPVIDQGPGTVLLSVLLEFWLSDGDLPMPGPAGQQGPSGRATAPSAGLAYRRAWPGIARECCWAQELVTCSAVAAVLPASPPGTDRRLAARLQLGCSWGAWVPAPQGARLRSLEGLLPAPT